MAFGIITATVRTTIEIILREASLFKHILRITYVFKSADFYCSTPSHRGVLTYFVMFATITNTDRLSIAAAAFSNTYLLHQLLWSEIPDLNWPLRLGRPSCYH